MAETQRSPEFCSTCQALARSTDPPGLRRLRFPFFKPLVKEHPATSDPNARLGFRRPVAKKTKLNTWTDQASLVSNRRLLPTGRPPVHGARESVNNINPPRVSTPIERFSALALACGIFVAPQIGPLCRATSLRGIYHASAIMRRLLRERRRDRRIAAAAASEPLGTARDAMRGGRRGMDTRRHAPLGRVRPRLVPSSIAQPARMPTWAAPAARSRKSMSATMPTAGAAAAFAGC